LLQEDGYWSRQKAILDERAAIREAELRLKEAIKQVKKKA